jgi:exosortase/archaeosortase family protein
VHGRRWRWEPDVHDRYVDYIIGIPLLLLALLVMLVVPVLLSAFFWRWRLDLLTLPIFVAGAVTLVFGLRTTLRLRAPIAFLLLAWPLPYTILIGDWIAAFTLATTAALRLVLAIVPVAQVAGAPEASLFYIPHGTDGFLVSVASTCAGVNGSLGFLLVGAALAGIVRGGLGRKTLWLIVGMTLIWGLNLVRILAIFAAGRAWGQDFAINALHPVIGLVLFNLGVLAAVVALPWFGLHLEPRSGTPGATSRQALPEAWPPPAGRHLPVRHAAIALLLVVLAGELAGLADSGLRASELVAQDLGQPRLTEWSAALAPVNGWSVRLTNSYPWVEQYFGRGATWNRYAYLADAPAGAAAGAHPVDFVNVDVITTSDLGTFSTYGLEACYGFHNYEILQTRRVDLGAGVAGHAVVYRNPTTATTWTAVYWEWPVVTGDRERYERVILNMSSLSARTASAGASSGGLVSTFQFALASAFGGNAGDLPDPSSVQLRDFLVGFAQQLLIGRAAQPGSLDPSSGS